jgi:uncharacterized membrane protein
MNRQQKIAWLQLTIIAIAAILSLINSITYMHRHGYTFSQACWLGSGWPVVFCFFGVVLTPLFLRKKKGQINFDERDLLIDSRASRITLGASFFFFIAACATLWFAVGIDTPIPAYWLGRIILGGWLTAAIVQAITTIVYYGWASKGEKS